MKQFKAFAVVLVFAATAHAKPIHIVLDPAHGGPTEWGITASGFDEKTVNLLLAKKIQALIETDDKYEVVLTRIGDYPLSLNERRKIANQYEQSIFVSVHSSLYAKEPSVISYVLKQAATKSNSILTPIELVHGKENAHSVKLAQMIGEEIPEHLNYEMIMAKYPMAPLVGIEAPAVMTECQCIPQNQQTWNENVLDDPARLISNGVQAFARKVY